jgi:hypothetical protein
VNIKNFLIDALTSALEIGLATPEDVMKHVTPEILGTSLPRPLWARLLTACLGAPKVDATLVIETVGVQNLCEHVPAPIIWTVVSDVAIRALGGVVPARPVDAAASAPSRPSPMPLNVSAPPPPDVKAERPTPPPPPGPSIPPPGSTPDPDAEVPVRGRAPTGQRFRQTNTNIGRLASSQRRPQASAGAPEPPAPPKRRAETEVEEVVEEAAKTSDDWRSSLAVEEDQLVDWSVSEETVTSAEERKR